MTLADYVAKMLMSARNGSHPRFLTDVARAIGVTPATLSRYESCQRRPSLDTLHAWAQELGVSLPDLISRYEENERKDQA